MYINLVCSYCNVCPSVYYPPEVSSIVWYSWVVKIRNTSEAVFRLQYTPWLLY